MSEIGHGPVQKRTRLLSIE